MPFLVVQEITPINLILVILGFSLCLLSYILRLAVHISSYRKGKDGLSFRFILVVTFLGYFGWGFWSGNDPVKMNIRSVFSVPAGASLALIGLGLFLYSEIKKHGVGTAGRLVTTGIYSKIRHPMYIGLVLLHIGLPFIFRSFVACISSILWALIIAVWTCFEEKNLERRFGQQFIDYKRRTWF